MACSMPMPMPSAGLSLNQQHSICGVLFGIRLPPPEADTVLMASADSSSGRLPQELRGRPWTRAFQSLNDGAARAFFHPDLKPEALLSIKAGDRAHDAVGKGLKLPIHFAFIPPLSRPAARAHG